ncbi:MAG: M14 family zinc carboxypeptidase [Chroococcales cyanobacterium]
MHPQISTIDLLQLASGDRLSLQVYKFEGYQCDKKVYIQANLHGSEIVGNAVIHQLIEFLCGLDETQILGNIWLVPLCNPLGANQRSHFFSTGRFNSYDGKDWNRIFWDYEKECSDLEDFAKSQLNLSPLEIQQNYLKRIQKAFAQEFEKLQSPSSLPYNEQYRYWLQSLCLDANYVIDIHSSSNDAIDYLFCFHDREESAKRFLLDYAILMNENQYDGDAFDEAFMKPWLALEKQLKALGKEIIFDIESWTLELGSGMEMKPESVNKGFEGIKNYLIYKGMLKLPNTSSNQTKTTFVKFINKDNIQKYYSPTGGMIQNLLPLGSLVKPGDILYQLLSFDKQEKFPRYIEVRAEKEGFIFDVVTNKASNQGDYVLTLIETEYRDS